MNVQGVPIPELWAFMLKHDQAQRRFNVRGPGFEGQGLYAYDIAQLVLTGQIGGACQIQDEWTAILGEQLNALTIEAVMPPASRQPLPPSR